MKKIKEGYTRLPNSVLQVLCFVVIRPEILRTCFAIFRLTFGWGTPERVLSYGYISLMTGLSMFHQWRAIKEALELNLIKRYNLRGESEANLKPIYVYSFNLEPKTWKIPIKTNIKHQVRLYQYFTSPKREKIVSPKQEIGISPKLERSIIDLLVDYQIK